MTRRILLVDDDDAIRMVARLALTRVAGWDVDAVGDADAAVAAVEDGPPDAVLLDVMMPGTDGPSTLERLRATPGGVDVPVVFLTAKLQPDEVERLRSFGVAGVLGKPFEPLQLAADIAAVLGWPQPEHGEAPA